ncbi:coproporphyrinogen III oxidase [Thecamonas trahens ATCC 50062]|uniref:Coproporphyrinogen III oxidase n=1 Tax=Thecamonas trahens ATCC 50062 TaxID=461836 RepID=A0A0L0DEI2_THETB|nr:coproporphyrinogen III oxidase [Thecamonas trahens ATCC 50062]KNC50737.1 coproporphyrinogen III oxidase [Thecamonas trahens ATCC 50062]|eukprot:XP_013756703.1 coproporphyrinogen III oxidase [Thecamonas trahens ATCC 50062]
MAAESDMAQMMMAAESDMAQMMTAAESDVAQITTAAAGDVVPVASATAAARPHDFTLQYPIRREYFLDTFVQQAPARIRKRRHNGARLVAAGAEALESSIAETVADLAESRPPLLVYVHVPFCASKCTYCNFAVDTRQTSTLHAAYVHALGRQMAALEAMLPPDKILGGIDIGGGTPTLLSTSLLRELLDQLAPLRARVAPSLEHPLSIETTPAIASAEPDKMAALVAGSVDRISMGLQSSSAAVLRDLNREAQVDAPARAADAIHAAGFKRFSVDIIFGLPDQTMEMWMADVAAAIALAPDAITTYDCLYRGKGRVMTRHTAAAALPSWRRHYGPMYDAAYDALAAAGYVAPYGSVNYSRQPGETGTSAYFEARLRDGAPYIGLGNYASSLLGGPLDTWAFAPYTVDGYLAAIDADNLFPADFAYALPTSELAAKTALLQLTFGSVDLTRLARSLGCDVDAVAAELGPGIAAACESGWLAPAAPGSNVFSVQHGAFAAMPSVRALFHTRGSLQWYQAQLRATTAR